LFSFWFALLFLEGYILDEWERYPGLWFDGYAFGVREEAREEARKEGIEGREDKRRVRLSRLRYDDMRCIFCVCTCVYLLGL
jgi:hypothetical protein